MYKHKYQNSWEQTQTNKQKHEAESVSYEHKYQNSWKYRHEACELSLQSMHQAVKKEEHKRRVFKASASIFGVINTCTFSTARWPGSQNWCTEFQIALLTYAAQAAQQGFIVISPAFHAYSGAQRVVPTLPSRADPNGRDTYRCAAVLERRSPVFGSARTPRPSN